MRSVGRPAGSDTRTVTSIPAVRLTSAAAMFAGALGLAASGGAPHQLTLISRSPTAITWSTFGLLVLQTAMAIASFRLARRGQPAAMPAAVLGSGLIAGNLILLVAGPSSVGYIALLVVVLVTGPLVGTCAGLAVSVVRPHLEAAAGGVVTTFTLLGSPVAFHLLVIGRGSGLRAAAALGCGYSVICLVLILRAHHHINPHHPRVSMDPGPPRGSPSLFMEEIDVSFEGRKVLDGASFALEPGELVALTGANGAGKSTLLRVAAGLQTPSAGHVYVDGVEITGLVPEERSTMGLAFVSGAHPLFPDLTVVENLRVAAYRTHSTREAFDDATDVVLRTIPAISERLSVKAAVLSGGEQRQLALAQTLYSQPKVLLADELTLGLDPRARALVLDLLRRMASEGIAVVVVDHDLEAVLPRVDRALLLTSGIIRPFKPASDILRDPEASLSARFLADVNA